MAVEGASRRWVVAPGQAAAECQSRLSIAHCLPASGRPRVILLKRRRQGCARSRLLLEPLQCLKEQLQRTGPDISALNKTLQQEWDHAANLHLGAVVIKKFSRRAAWWNCSWGPDGHLHRWQARISDRSLGKGCPQCSGRKLCLHNSLATKAPSVAVYWDSAKNSCNADSVIANSHQPAHLRCSQCKHEWITTPNAKMQHISGCPKCEARRRRPRTHHPSFAECQHPLLAEWDHDRNASEGLFPDNVPLRSNKQVHWLCNKCPLGQQHLYTAQPVARTSRKPSGCPFCAGKAACKCNSLQTHFPSIAAEWDYAKNSGTPHDYTSASHREVWWRTAERGSWEQGIQSRTHAIVRLAATRTYVKEQT